MDFCILKPFFDDFYLVIFCSCMNKCTNKRNHARMYHFRIWDYNVYFCDVEYLLSALFW